MMIKVESLNKFYNKNLCVLKDINLEIKKGEIVGIVGSSGCGKSTFLRTLNALETINSGNIFIDGIKLDSKRNIKEARKKIGIVFQGYNLFENYTVIENITLAPIKVKKMDKMRAYNEARELLRKVDLLERENFYPHQLSGGQKQRVAIARCLAMEPQILLFDEPTSALDPQMTLEVLNVMRELKNDGLTMVIVSHELRFLSEIADKIVFMHNNTIWEQSSSYDFFNNPKTSEANEFLSHVQSL